MQTLIEAMINQDGGLLAEEERDVDRRFAPPIKKTKPKHPRTQDDQDALAHTEEKRNRRAVKRRRASRSSI